MEFKYKYPKNEARQAFSKYICKVPKAHSTVIKLVTHQVKLYITELQNTQKTLILANIGNQCKS